MKKFCVFGRITEMSKERTRKEKKIEGWICIYIWLQFGIHFCDV